MNATLQRLAEFALGPADPDDTPINIATHIGEALVFVACVAVILACLIVAA